MHALSTLKGWIGLLVLATASSACARPALSRDGQLVFSEGEQRGASILTAQGVEFRDRDDPPSPVLRKSAFEPWRAPTGFILPRDGVLRATSKPYPIATRGMAIVLRPSDVWVPSWGGELLLRLDAVVPPEAHPAEQSSMRKPASFALVLDDDQLGALPLAESVIDALGASDRVTVIDSAKSARVAVPLVPGTHRSLLEGAVLRALEQRSIGTRRPRDLGAALGLARRALGARARGARVIVLSDGLGVVLDPSGVAREARKLSEGGARVIAVGANDRVAAGLLDPSADEVVVGREEDRLARLEELFQPPGEMVLTDVMLSFGSAPAPARLLESSSGEISMTLETDTLDLGDLYVGEARTEVVRLAVPAWTPNERYELTVNATYRDATGRAWRAKRRISMRYTDDIERIAKRRAGDVIAYASALAMVRRLERVFMGSRVERLGGMRGLVRWQADSMAVLAKERHDPSLARQAEVLTTLLGAIDE